MPRYVLDAAAAIRIVEDGLVPAPVHQLLAPTILRSEVLERLYRRVQTGELTEAAGLELLGRFAKVKIRYLGDAVLRRRAWTIAARLGLASTGPAEYLALTQLQADALVAEGLDLPAEARSLVAFEPLARILDAAGR